MIPAFLKSSKTGFVFCRTSAQNSVVFPGLMRIRTTRETGPWVKFSCAISDDAPAIKRNAKRNRDILRIAGPPFLSVEGRVLSEVESRVNEWKIFGAGDGVRTRDLELGK